MIPLSPSNEGDAKSIFVNSTIGIVSARDAWCFNSSNVKLRANIERSVNSYNAQLLDFQRTEPVGTLRQRQAKARAYVDNDPRSFHWNGEAYRDLANGIQFALDENGFRDVTYRPFFKQRLYFNSQLIVSIRDFPQIYPNESANNLGIYITGPGSSIPLTALMTDGVADAGLASGNGSSPYIPRYRYVSSQNALGQIESHEFERISNINPQALAEFRQHYADPRVTEDDLFYYTYGVLHSQQWRDTFANDLARSQARIPMAASLADFHVFVQAGRELADLHVNYESVQPYPMNEIYTDGWDANSPDAFRVTKMKYAGRARNPDKSTVIYNAGIILSDIPEKAYEYRLGTRSGLDWLIDRYQVRTHKASGITNDPNDWAAETGEPRYILDLIKRIVTVSVRTVDIVEALPELPI